MMTSQTLTPLEAYAAMVVFLEAYWERGGKSSEELAGLLGSMNRTIFVDAGTADPAQWEDWLHAVTKIKEKSN